MSVVIFMCESENIADYFINGLSKEIERHHPLPQFRTIAYDQMRAAPKVAGLGHGHYTWSEDQCVMMMWSGGVNMTIDDVLLIP